MKYIFEKRWRTGLISVLMGLILILQPIALCQLPIQAVYGAIQGTTDLGKFTVSVVLKDLAGNPVPQENGKYQVRENTTYRFELLFREVDPEIQMAASDVVDESDHVMLYNLPNGVNFIDGFDGITQIAVAPAGGGTPYNLNQCTYHVSGDQLRFEWSYENDGGRSKEDVENDLGSSIDTFFTITLDGIVTQGVPDIDFHNNVIISVDYINTRDLGIDKTIGNYDPYTQTLEYGIKVNSIGYNTGIILQDLIDNEDNGMTYKDGSVQVIYHEYGAGSEEGVLWTAGTDYTIQPDTDYKGYTIEIPALKDQDYVDITYLASIDPSRLDMTEQETNSSIVYKKSSNSMKNTASVTSDQVTTPKSKEAVIDRQIQYPAIQKTVSSSNIEAEAGQSYDLTWTVTLKNYHDMNSAGHTITDTVTSNPEMITGFDENSVVIKRQINTWSDTGITRGTAEEYSAGTFTYNDLSKSWTYWIPSEAVPAENQEYIYTITYKTTITPGAVTDTKYLVNSVQDDSFGSRTSTASVGPLKPKVSKQVGSYSKDYVEWIMKLRVPKEGIDADHIVYLNDELPHVQLTNDQGETVTVYDELEGTIQDIEVDYSEQISGETWYPETTEKGFRIVFQKDNGTNAGFSPSTATRWITITYRTKNNQEWLKASADDSSVTKNHRNDNALWLDGSWVSASHADIFLVQRRMTKSFVEQVGYEWQNHTYDEGSHSYIDQELQTLPAFRYDIVLSSIGDDCFDSEGYMYITDTFDGRYLKLCDMSSERVDGQDYTTYNSELKNSHLRISFSNDAENNYVTNQKHVSAEETESGKVILKVHKNDLSKNGGRYYLYYKLTYYLQIIDQEVEQKLAKEAVGAQDYTLHFTNTASVSGFSDSTAITPYRYDLVDKTHTPWGGDQKETIYTIMVNPSGIDLDPYGDELQLVDTYSKISIDFSTIQVEPEEGARWDASGNSLIFTIPDETPIKITYKAYIVGTGNIEYSNYVTLRGQRSGETNLSYFSSTGSGGASSVAINIMKYTGGNMKDGLSGVTFMLYDKDTDRKLKEFTTDANGRAIIFGNQSADGFTIRRGHAYYLVEKEPPSGYKRDTTKYQFTIAESDDAEDLYQWGTWKYRNNDIMTIKNERLEFSMPIRKTWIGDPADQAEFELYCRSGDAEDWKRALDVDGNIVPSLILTADLQWQSSFQHIPRYDEQGNMLQYQVKEVNLPLNYLSDGGVRVNDSTAARIDEGFIFTNTELEASDLYFKKYGYYKESCADDPEELRPLEGVVFGIYDRTDPSELLVETTSDPSGQIIVKDLPYGEYIIRELSTLPGYILDDTLYYARIDAQGYHGLSDSEGNPVKDNLIVNDCYWTDIRLRKVSESDQDRYLTDSWYGLYKNNDSGDTVLVCKAVTDEDGYLTFHGIRTGIQYTIKELEAPEGYYVSEYPISFCYILDDQGRIILDEENLDLGNGTVSRLSNGELVWMEPEIRILIHKLDQRGNYLAGAKLHIEDQNGKNLESWVSSDSEYEPEYELKAGQTYTLVEDSAPSGYDLADNVEFHIREEMGPNKEYTQIVTMIDRDHMTTTVESTDTTEISTNTSEATTSTNTSEATTSTNTSEVTTSTNTSEVTVSTASTENESVETGDSKAIITVLYILSICVLGMFMTVVTKKR